MHEVDHSDMKLGKKIGKVEDPRTLQAAKLMTTTVVRQAPQRYHAGRLVTDWPMYANDQFGDCAFAAPAHLDITWDTQARDIQEPRATTEEVLELYSFVTGFDVRRPETDNGAYLLDVANALRQRGLGGEKIGAFAEIQMRNQAQLRTACWMFGGLYIGANLSISAQRQPRWIVTDGPDAVPGSWGGHAMALTGYDEHGVDLITWGARKRASWGWVDKYVFEGYALLSSDWIYADTGKTPAGFKQDYLLNYLSNL
jgi:hypothetical protein